MSKRIKIWFHSGTSSDIKEISLPAYLLWFLSLIVLGCLPMLSWVGYDYYQLKGAAYDNASLAENLEAREAEIQSQRMQIQSFAKSIDSLKNQVTVLSELEDRVRLIADIQKKGDQSGLIGIGGIPLNDLDPDLPLEAKHNSLLREMHTQVNQTILAAKHQKTDFNSLISQLEKKKNLLASTPSIRPVDGWITSKFGYRKSPFTGQRSFHSGLDIANKTGTKIISTANGRVSYAGRKMYIGNLVILDHGYGKTTKYGHLKKILVKPGQRVKRGEVIALLGNTGQSTGPHVHYEVIINGLPVNPLKYILN
ncbi:M23 family metallopeptidase [Desulfospira joergensenii]|uniref:M23 family metallopeptidase n=1 Tax=Desulfospira joergensenii TaxID=53329 RepID=UPI0003B41F39|nr:M23 family metallopeptidase [Desulfospira joergensenii]